MSSLVKADKLSVENDVELRALCNMLRMAKGFTLGLARVNHPAMRVRLAAEVRRAFEGRLSAR